MSKHLVLVQPDVVWEDREANFARVRGLLEDVRPEPRSLIILPEMFAVGFTMNVEGVAEEPGGPTERFLRELASNFDSFIVGGVVSRASSGKGLNEAVVAGPEGDVIARYAKLHPFTYAGETEHYERGRDIVTFDWDGLMTAPFICYDLRFPEVYRMATMRGAGLLVTIANFPSARVHHWRTLLIARAIENQAYVVGVNRSGTDPNVEYPGRSLVVDPRGDILSEAGAGEEVLKVEISVEEMERYRAALPVLRDIRVEMGLRSKD